MSRLLESDIMVVEPSARHHRRAIVTINYRARLGVYLLTVVLVVVRA